MSRRRWEGPAEQLAVTLGAVLVEAALEAMEVRSRAASPGPWTAFVEGRDHVGGDDFIRVSDFDDEPDMYVSRSTSEGLRPASAADLDFIASARQDIPMLVAEVRRLRRALGRAQ
jgi:hypothetical protein